MIVGVGASRVRDLFAAGQGRRARDHLHRRARRDRPLARGRRRQHLRRPRRARADAQPDPHRDGRLRPAHGRDRAGRRPTGRRSSTRRCCARAASTAASSSSRRTAPAARRSSRVHTRSVPLDPDVDLGAIAASTPGMVGADLANLVNEAALLAARRDHEKVDPRGPHRRAGADRARRRAQGDADRGRPPPHRLPRGRPRDRRHAHRRAPTRCARCRSSPAARRSGSPSRRPTPIASTSTSAT